MARVGGGSWGSRPHGKLFFGGTWAPVVTGNEVVEVVFDAAFLEFIEEVGGYGFFKFLFLSIFEGSSVGIIPMGKSVRAQHPPTIVKGVLGFLPFLDGAKNFVKFFDTEVGDILAVVSEG